MKGIYQLKQNNFKQKAEMSFLNNCTKGFDESTHKTNIYNIKENGNIISTTTSIIDATTIIKNLSKLNKKNKYHFTLNK